MKKSGSVIKVSALYILIVNILDDVLFHILQTEKIRPKIAAKIDRVAAALLKNQLNTCYLNIVEHTGVILTVNPARS